MYVEIAIKQRNWDEEIDQKLLDNGFEMCGYGVNTVEYDIKLSKFEVNKLLINIFGVEVSKYFDIID